MAAEEVAGALTELALGEPTGVISDLAGPQVLQVDEILPPLFALRGRGRPLWRLRMPGAVGRAYRAGDNLAGANARHGKETWKQHLAESVTS